MLHFIPLLLLFSFIYFFKFFKRFRLGTNIEFRYKVMMKSFLSSVCCLHSLILMMGLPQMSKRMWISCLTFLFSLCTVCQHTLLNFAWKSDEYTSTDSDQTPSITDCILGYVESKMKRKKNARSRWNGPKKKLKNNNPFIRNANITK